MEEYDKPVRPNQGRSNNMQLKNDHKFRIIFVNVWSWSVGSIYVMEDVNLDVVTVMQKNLRERYV